MNDNNSQDGDHQIQPVGDNALESKKEEIIPPIRVDADQESKKEAIVPHIRVDGDHQSQSVDDNVLESKKEAIVPATVGLSLYLPPELVEEMLCHFQATSLNRLRSTCKWWNRLFEDRIFARRHWDKAFKQYMVLMYNNGRILCASLNLHGGRLTGQLNLPDSHSNSAQPYIKGVSYCDGLLLCRIKENTTTKLVVWNPCTRETKCITPSDPHSKWERYTLGSCQDRKSGNIHYKILSGGHVNHGFPYELCDVDSGSWRVLEFPHKCTTGVPVSMKGKTFWIGKKDDKDIVLAIFDYTTERFEFVPLFPGQITLDHGTGLSLFREDRLSMYVEDPVTFRKDIWLSGKIGEDNVVPWSKVLTVHAFHDDWDMNASFLIDEGMKFVVWCEQWLSHDTLYIGEEDNLRKYHILKKGGGPPHLPKVFYYVPNLIRISSDIDRAAEESVREAEKDMAAEAEKDMAAEE